MWCLKSLNSLILLVLFLTSSNLFDKPYRILGQIKAQEKNNKKVTLFGSISLPDDIECPYIYICHKGKLIKIKNTGVNSFSIKDFDCCQINLLFVSAENVILSSQLNTILNIQLCDSSKYKFFRLDKSSVKINHKEQLATWKIVEDKLPCAHDEVGIPLNTIMVLLDPNSIDFHLQNKTFKTNSNAIDLPKIVINDIKNITKFEKSCLAFLDLKPFHGKQEAKTDNREKVNLQLLK